jgi:glycosyltransferase involved in cell wall biosynthesis
MRAFPIHDAHAFRGPASGLDSRRLALARRWPLAVARTWSPDAAGLVQRAADAGAAVVLDFVTAGAYRPAGGAVVYSLHNAEAERLRAMPAPTGGPRRLERAYEQWATTRWEQRALADPAARIVTVSEHDAALLGINATVVPNGTDLPSDPPPPPAAGPMLFVGSLDYAPNHEAVRWWSREVWPLLPDGTGPLHVVGRTGPMSAAPPGVELLGEVVDLSPHLAGASLSVVPLLSGGGTRLKILEAMAWRRPVLTTSKGAEGLGPDLLSCLEVVDGAPALAAAALAMLADPAGRRDLGDRARDAVGPYDWQQLGAQFATVVLG